MIITTGIVILHCIFTFIEAMALLSSAESAAVSQSLPSEGIITMIAWIINVHI